MSTGPLARITAASAELRAAEEAARDAREARDAAIVAALRQDVQQAAIVRITGLSREAIRRIARAGGIEGK